MQAYADFVLAGGVPSEFNGLTAELLQAYLEALSASGYFDTLLAGQAEFLNAYLAFLQGGGNIDDFTGLPQPFTFPVPQGQLASNQFMALRGSRTELAPFNGQIDRSRSDVIYDETTGAPLYFKFGSTRAAIGDAQLIEAGRISTGGVSWGRWVNGTAYAQTDTALPLGEIGVHVIAGPMVTNMPATGLIEYDFVGGTNPTLTGGEVGSLSTAKAAISFGSVTRVGAELTTDFADRSYTLRTVGGIAATAQNGIALRQDLAPGFFFGEVLQTTGGLIEVVGTGAACASACTGEIRGYISGDEAAELAVSYIAKDAGGVEVLGAAGFAKGDPIDTGTGGGTGGGTDNGGDFSTALAGANFDTTFAGTFYIYPVVNSSGQTDFNSVPTLGPAARNAAGAITQLNDYRNPSVIRWSQGTAELLDQRGDDRALLLTYGPGDVGFFGSTTTASDYGLLASVANAATFLPTAGSVTYDLLYTTPAYSLNPALADGTFDAQIAVQFGSVPRLGLEGTLTLDTAYTFSTIGGVASPQINRNLARTDFFLQASLSGEGLLCTSAIACSLALRGVFSDDYERIASTWITQQNGQTVYGASIFGADEVPGLSLTGGAGEQGGSLTADFGAGGVNLAFADGGGLNRLQTNRQVYTAAGTPFSVQFDDRGITSATASDRLLWERGTLLTTDLAGTAQWQVGRYTGGRFETGLETAVGTIWGSNNGFAYAAIAPLSGSLPATGTIAYSLLAATRPTYSDERTAPGTFAAQMALLLGAAPKLGVEGSITMPDASYDFTTIGGIADPAASQLFFNATFLNFSGSASITGSGDGSICQGGGCAMGLAGSIGGDAGALANLSYYVSGASTTSAPNISGAAVFAGEMATGGGGTTGDLPNGTAVANQLVAYASTVVGIDSRNETEVIYSDTTGAPLAHQWLLNDFTTENERPNIGSNVENESGSVAGIIGWTRWAGGTTGGRYYDAPTIDIAANKGWHEVAGTAATNLPQSGTVSYQLVGNTNPTIRDGSLAPGTFSGELAVAFGATPKVGVDFAIGFGGNAYSIVTPGGVADPMAGGMPVRTDTMEFGTVFDQPVYASGGNCTGDACRVDMRGFLAGEGASHVGVTYTFGQTFDTQIDGSAVFGVAP